MSESHAVIGFRMHKTENRSDILRNLYYVLIYDSNDCILPPSLQKLRSRL